MTRSIKLTLMFVPVFVLLIGVALVAYDLKNPLRVESDQCTVIGTGQLVSQLKRVAAVVYDQGASSLYDIGLQCNTRGVVFVNDREVFQVSMIQAGYPAKLRHKTYRYWPETWRFQIGGKP